MPIPKEIIDHSEGNKLVSFLNNVLKENPKTNFDVATAFFNIQTFAMIKDNLNGVKRFGDLKRYGWLEVRLDPEDSRIRFYKLKDPSEAVKEMKDDGN